jgi:hypothetical protein
MSLSLELQQKGLIEAFLLKSHDVAEAKDSLLGFFSTLQKIEKRLVCEGKLIGKEEYV